MQRSPESDQTVGAALTQVIVAGQQLLIDRLDLALLEGRQLFAKVAVSIALMCLGALLLLGALITADFALVDLVEHSASRSSALFSCAALHVAIGGALLYAGIRRRR